MSSNTHHFAAAAARRLEKIPKSTVWTEFTPMAIKHKAVNLGQGFPTFVPPRFVLENAQKVFAPDTTEFLDHQYCRSMGHLDLVRVLQDKYTKLLGHQIQETDVVVTNGVTQGLNLAIQAFVDSGDEVVCFEPFFDLYCNDVHMANGSCKIVPLHIEGPTANDWRVKEADLRAAITDRTKVILLNTPQNVPGKVWSRDELEMVARVVRGTNIVVFSDEVYMTLVYDGIPHIPFASLPDMFERTVTMCSAGKTFSVTGWKLGWIVGPSYLIAPIQQVQAHQSFSISTPLQRVVAKSLVDAESNGYYAELLSTYERKRKLLCDVLSAAGLDPVVPQGGFFVLANISKVSPTAYMDPNDTTDVGRDWQFCRWLTKDIGVTAIPTSAFCSVAGRARYDMYARFAFCKSDADIEEAGRRLLRLKEFF